MENNRRLVDWDDTYVSTGHLPPSQQVAEYVAEAHSLFGLEAAGQVSQVYPALAEMPSAYFGVSMVDTAGHFYEAGEAGVEFTIMSVSKPFLFALICDRIGSGAVRQKVGMNATGLGFNSLAGIERHAEGLTNPMVNAGAIASTSLAPGGTLEERWDFILEGLSRFAGRELRVNQEVYASASETNFRNRSIV
jgi:glutaminase